jgi:ppGpp synthetase/RelA/SpoT-type nucleotidyltranferase
MYGKEQIKELQQIYEEMLPNLKKAEGKLREAIERAIAEVEDKWLTRAQLRGTRVKTFDSLRRKAETKGLEPHKVVLHVGDLVGARVVCNNIDDVYRFRELLCRVLPEVESQTHDEDYIRNPQPSRYRALHVNLRLSVGDLIPTGEDYVPCEIQIRTLLQDSWAELVHHDIYKEGAELPEYLRERTVDLAELLKTADTIAGRVRERVAKETIPEEERLDLETVSKNGLAYVFSQVFGRYPSDYVTQTAYNACLEVGLADLTEISHVLGDKEFRESINAAYKRELGISMTQEDIFFLAPVAASQGKDKAIEAAIKQAKTEREEIENFWRSEVLGELP